MFKELYTPLYLRFRIEQEEGLLLPVVDVLLDPRHLPLILQEHSGQVTQFSKCVVVVHQCTIYKITVPNGINPLNPSINCNNGSINQSIDQDKIKLVTTRDIHILYCCTHKT